MSSTKICLEFQIPHLMEKVEKAGSRHLSKSHLWCSDLKLIHLKINLQEIMWNVPFCCLLGLTEYNAAPWKDPLV